MGVGGGVGGVGGVMARTKATRLCSQRRRQSVHPGTGKAGIL